MIFLAGDPKVFLLIEDLEIDAALAMFLLRLRREEISVLHLPTSLSSDWWQPEVPSADWLLLLSTLVKQSKKSHSSGSLRFFRIAQPHSALSDTVL